MNPALVKIATNKYVIYGTGILIALLVVYIVFKKFGKSISGAVSDAQFNAIEGTDLGSLIQQYRAAMNPSGVSWLISTDGTDEEAILKLAQQTKGNVDAVFKAYRQKFNSNLTDDLRQELSTEEYETWYEIINE